MKLWNSVFKNLAEAMASDQIDPDAWVTWDRDVILRLQFDPDHISTVVIDSGDCLTVFASQHASGPPGYIEFRRDPVPHWAAEHELENDSRMAAWYPGTGRSAHWIYDSDYVMRRSIVDEFTDDDEPSPF